MSGVFSLANVREISQKISKHKPVSDNLQPLNGLLSIFCSSDFQTLTYQIYTLLCSQWRIRFAESHCNTLETCVCLSETLFIVWLAKLAWQQLTEETSRQASAAVFEQVFEYKLIWKCDLNGLLLIGCLEKISSLIEQKPFTRSGQAKTFTNWVVSDAVRISFEPHAVMRRHDSIGRIKNESFQYTLFQYAIYSRIIYDQFSTQTTSRQHCVSSRSTIKTTVKPNRFESD